MIVLEMDLKLQRTEHGKRTVYSPISTSVTCRDAAEVGDRIAGFLQEHGVPQRSADTWLRVVVFEDGR